MEESFPARQPEQPTPHFGVADMTPQELSDLIAHLDREEQANRISLDEYSGVNREIEALCETDPEKAKELIIAMAKSDDENARNTIAYNLADLIQIDERTGTSLFAEMLSSLDVDPDASRFALQDAVESGKLSASQVAEITVLLAQDAWEGRRRLEQQGRNEQ